MYLLFSVWKEVFSVSLKIPMASYLRTVAGGPSTGANSNNPTNDIGKRLAKWALIIGVPTAVCVAAYLVYRQQQEQEKKSAARRSSLPTPLAGAASATTTTTSGRAGGDAASSSDNRVKVRSKLNPSVKSELNSRSMIF